MKCQIERGGLIRTFVPLCWEIAQLCENVDPCYIMVILSCCLITVGFFSPSHCMSPGDPFLVE